MKRLLACSPLAVALALAGCDGTATGTATGPLLRPSFDAGGGQGMNLHPSGFGEGSFTAWQPQQGEPDSKGNQNFAFYFQKMTTTATVAAGVAVIIGLEGQPASDLYGLSWDRRTDGWCGAGAPRWDVFVTDASGNSHTVFLGCAAADHSLPFTTGTNTWITDSYNAAEIAAAVVAAGGSPTDKITGLIMVFDEGTDVGPGFVFLDNITVNTKTWTSPRDNSN